MPREPALGEYGVPQLGGGRRNDGDPGLVLRIPGRAGLPWMSNQTV